MWLSPYRDLKHDVISTICQTQIFLALLAATMLQADPGGARSPWVDSVLTGLAVVPVALCAVLASPVGSYLVNGQRREKALRLLGKGLATAARWLRGRCTKGKDCTYWHPGVCKQWTQKPDGGGSCLKPQV